MSDKIYLGMPLYSCAANPFSVAAMLKTPSRGEKFSLCGSTRQSSFLTKGFNSLWADAINRMSEGVTHFAMLHGDVVPQHFFLDILYEEMREHDADMVSVVVPIKEASGDTSTAVDDPDCLWTPHRLSMSEVFSLPETFCEDDVHRAGIGHPEGCLLLNTGCWLADLRKPWATKANPQTGYLQVHFCVRDAIYKNDQGKWCEAAASEDWNFSRLLAMEGARLFATRKVRVRHFGETSWPNDQVWGIEPEATRNEEKTLGQT